MKILKSDESGLEKKSTQASLYESLVNYEMSDFYPCHMPGHKRRRGDFVMSDFFGIDITEIDGFDNLHQAEGIIRQARERAANLYGSEETYFLVNGSTCGILAAISSATDMRDTILIARNCHKSVYNAALLKELNLRYIYPNRIAEYDIADAVSPYDVKTALEACPECKAVIITSPTYEGIVSDIKEISSIVHEKGKILIVDEAHGAHFGLAQGMPENAVRQGADIVIHSLHKTLPSMTQTAILHVNGPRINRAKLLRYLSIYQSSSPSYVLMASMDSCISYLEKNAAVCFKNLIIYHKNFLINMQKCRHIRIGEEENTQKNRYCYIAWDICKLVISVKGTSINGQELFDILLHEFHIQPEMASDSYVLAIMTIADKEEGWKRLADALLQIDGRIEDRTEYGMEGSMEYITEDAADNKEVYETPTCTKSYAKYTIAQAFERGIKEIPLEQACGETAGDFIYPYPPGIPVLVPGETIDGESIKRIRKSLESGLRIQGVSEKRTIAVIKDNI